MAADAQGNERKPLWDIWELTLTLWTRIFRWITQNERGLSLTWAR